MQQVMTLDQIAARAPSVFAQQPYEKMSARYDFIPTDTVLRRMMDEGFMPVSASQSRCRLPGKADFTRHVIRLRHGDLMRPQKVGDEIPEIVLLNSHDGSSAYNLMLGFFRLVCSNGLIVNSGMVDQIRVRHSGNSIDDVLEGSFSIVKEAPKAIEQIERFKSVSLAAPQQRAFAEAAYELRGSALEVRPEYLLHARRAADNSENNGNRDLWKTMNVIQENVVRGGIKGRTSTNRRNTLRGISSVDADTKFNRALWKLTEEMERLASGG